ncbi:MAG: DUF3107 domain-containing protein [Acidimicrobiia bacterium]
MEVRIGVIHTPKEISFETDAGAEAVMAQIDEAVTAGKPLAWLEDKKGRRVGVPADKIGYVELLVDDPSHKVGFGR